MRKVRKWDDGWNVGVKTRYFLSFKMHMYVYASHMRRDVFKDELNAVGNKTRYGTALCLF